MNELNAFDRMGVLLFWGSDSPFIDHLALTFTNPLVWLPLFLSLLYLVAHNNPTKRDFLLCMAAICVCFALSAGVCNLIVKPLVCRVRPCNVPELREMFYIPGGYGEKNYSFFSSHSANFMALTTFFALLVRNRMLTITLFLLALINMWTRLYLGQHYLSDICVGILWGIVSGFIAWEVYMRISNHKISYSAPSAIPIVKKDIYMVTGVFIITILFVVVFY